ncbi:hypothetical protein JCM11641_006297 [Rhodosporidiobolus odoratus]
MHSLVLALPLRLLSAFLSRAHFQPDEYWQNLEIAHRWVWGYGRATWEWRTQFDDLSSTAAGHGGWPQVVKQVVEGGRGGIRSPLPVLPTAAAYWLLKQTGWDTGWLLVLVPRSVQAVFAAATDVAVCRLSRRLLGPRYAGAALLASLLSFFHFYTLSRTFSNSTETSLTALALSYWPWSFFRSPSCPSMEADKDRPSPPSTTNEESLWASLALAALATIMRPSNGVIWLLLGAMTLDRARAAGQGSLVLRTAVLMGLLASLFTFVLDTMFGGTPTFTPLRFLSLNLFHQISTFYGRSPWHYYLFQAIPLLLFTQLPFFLDGVFETLQSRGVVQNEGGLRALLFTAAGTTIVYSCLSHKEWRFLHPLLPIFHLFVGRSLVSRAGVPGRTSANSALAPRSTRVRTRHLLLFLLSLPPAIYLTTFHGLGQNDAMHYLSTILAEGRRTDHTTTTTNSTTSRQTGGGTSVGMLMPCHSTGWQAFLHAPQLELEEEQEGAKRLWQLECEPPIRGQSPSTYLDQSDYFYASPSTYLLSRFPSEVDPSFPPSPALPLVVPNANDPNDLGWSHAWPERFVVFSNLLELECDTSLHAVRTKLVGECGEEGTIGGLFKQRGYRVEKRFWNAIEGWNDDSRRKGEVVILRWERQGQ